MTYYKYFKYSEFDSPDQPGSGEKMDIDFITKLTNARISAGVPFIINSGYRTKEHNKKIGGSPQSMHILGRAADIKCTGFTAPKIVQACLQEGFRVLINIPFGSSVGFVHVDDKEPQQVRSY